jgi:hypothetical protein
MDNTILNWRFGAYHLQILRWEDWRVFDTLYWRLKGVYFTSYPITLSYNPSQAENSMTVRKLFSLTAWRNWFERM